MPNYQNGKIYKIVCLNTGLIYVGSTTQPLCKRLASHKTKTNSTNSKKIIEGGNFIIVLIENFACNSVEELHKREYEIIESTVCVNRKLLSEEERKNYHKKWRADHAEYHKEWCNNHKGYKTIWAKNKRELSKNFIEYENAISK